MGSNPARDKAKNKKEKGEKQHEYKPTYAFITLHGCNKQKVKTKVDPWIIVWQDIESGEDKIFFPP